MGFSFPLWVLQQILLRPLAAQDIDGTPVLLFFYFFLGLSAIQSRLGARSFFPGAATITVTDRYQKEKKKKLFTFSHLF